MDEAECKTAEVIAKNIDQLESAVQFAFAKMEPALFEAACDVFRAKSDELGWIFVSGDNFEDIPWLAPLDWSADRDESKGNYHLYCRLVFEGPEAETWLAVFSGSAGRRVRLAICSNTISGREWQKNDTKNLEQAVLEAGFDFTAKGKDFAISLPLNFDRKQLVEGYRDDDLSEAMEPLALAIDKVNKSRPLFDKIASAIAKISSS